MKKVSICGIAYDGNVGFLSSWIKSIEKIKFSKQVILWDNTEGAGLPSLPGWVEVHGEGRNLRTFSGRLKTIPFVSDDSDFIWWTDLDDTPIGLGQGELDSLDSGVCYKFYVEAGGFRTRTCDYQVWDTFFPAKAMKSFYSQGLIPPDDGIIMYEDVIINKMFSKLSRRGFKVLDSVVYSANGSHTLYSTDYDGMRLKLESLGPSRRYIDRHLFTTDRRWFSKTLYWVITNIMDGADMDRKAALVRSYYTEDELEGFLLVMDMDDYSMKMTGKTRVQIEEVFNRFIVKK